MMLNHINHKMPIYKDCTLFELIIVSGGYLVGCGAILSLLTWIFIGYASIGCALTMISMVHMTRFLLGRLQRLKHGKPYGYYQQLFLRKLSDSALSIFWQSPQITREDRWSVRREQ